MTSRIDIACDYALNGYKIFPSIIKKTNDGKLLKTPITPNGFKDATSNLDQVQTWWRKTPEAFVSLACAANSIVIVDIDLYKPSVKEAKDILEQKAQVKLAGR